MVTIVSVSHQSLEAIVYYAEKTIAYWAKKQTNKKKRKPL